MSISYVAAAEGVLDAPFPVGMGLRVPLPPVGSIVTGPPSRFPGQVQAQPQPALRRDVIPDNHGLVDFDDLDPGHVFIILSLVSSTDEILR